MSNRVEDLHPVFQPVAGLVLAEAGEEIHEQFPGSTIRAAVTFRTLSEQAAAKAAGASRLSLGMHNFGLALDVAVIGENGDYVLNGEDLRYQIFGRVAKAHGLVWGGDWQQADPDHCEARMNGTPIQLAAWLDAHRIDAG